MTARFIVADVFDGLATLETGSVDLIVTSPPFLALRSYLPADHELKGKEIGSEATPAEFIDTLLRVTAELRRVLAPHGSICVELGDTYAGSGGTGGDYNEDGLRDGQAGYQGSAQKHAVGRSATRTGEPGRSIPGRSLTPIPTVGSGWPLAKSRTLIPSLYQIALAYGFNPLTGLQSPAGQWRVRNVVTWARPNPPVGALGDKWRPATSDLIVACTSSKRYWDDLATRRPGGNAVIRHVGDKASVSHLNPMERGEIRNGEHSAGAPLLDYWVIPLLEGEEEKPYGPAPQPKNHARIAKGAAPRTDLPSQQRDGNWNTLPQQNDDPDGPGSPLLDYWVIPPGGYTGSHYAVFPEELVVPCVQAMCPQRVCRVCGEPSRRITGDTEYVNSRTGKPVTTLHFRDGHDAHDERHAHLGGSGRLSPNSDGMGDRAATAITPTLGWSDCGHDTWRPGLILDCFGGSGTTGVVATGHGHDCVLIDLDERNCELARDRIGPFMFEGPIYVGERPADAAPTLAGESSDGLL